jgi:hypothetical protein
MEYIVSVFRAEKYIKQRIYMKRAASNLLE